jgi:hypothetical protein
MAVPGSIAEKSLGYQQILAAAVDVGSLLTVPPGTSLVTIVPEGQAVRYRDDGVAPTASVGMPLAVGSFLRYDAQNLQQLKFISQVAGAILNVTYYAQ